MEFQELDGDSSVSLTNWMWDAYAGFYGVQATMTVQSYGFTGTNDEVWFFRDEFAAFVQALQYFTHNHKGEARLDSVSPEETMVSVRRWDAAAHVLIEAQVSRQLFHRHRAFLNRVSVAFEVDPSQLPAAVEALATVLAEGEQS